MLSKFANRLFFSIADDELKIFEELLEKYIFELSEDIQKLKSIDLNNVEIFYTNKNNSLTLLPDFVEPETSNVDALKSLVESYVFSNIKL